MGSDYVGWWGQLTRIRVLGTFSISPTRLRLVIQDIIYEPIYELIMATAVTREDPLTRAIKNADEHTLRNILKSMCRDSEVCRKEAMERMLVSRKHELIELSDSSDDDGQRQDKKRKKVEVEVAQISRYEKCATCEATYDVTLNNDEACRTHEGQPLIPLLRAQIR